MQSLNERSDCDDMDGDYDVTFNIKPKMSIEGATAIKKYHIVNDKRHILTQDSEGNVSLYDVLQVCIDFENFFALLQ